jgi:hypothetical protein
MCIIIVKNAGVEMPTLDVLENCWNANPDGMGFMHATGGVVFGEKYFELDDMYNDLRKVPKERPCVIHFRWATHGSTEIDAAHPFPISRKVSDVRSIVWTSDIGCAHNGVIPGFGSKTQKSGILSDTQDFIVNVLSRKRIRENLFSQNTIDTITEITKSKWAFLNEKGEVEVVGKFFEDEGLLFSNLDYTDELFGWKKYDFPGISSAYSSMSHDFHFQDIPDQGETYCRVFEDYLPCDDTCSYYKFIGGEPVCSLELEEYPYI